MRTAKMWVAALGTVVTALGAAFADDVIGTGEIANLASVVVTVALTMYATYRVPNRHTSQDRTEQTKAF